MTFLQDLPAEVAAEWGRRSSPLAGWGLLVSVFVSLGFSPVKDPPVTNPAGVILPRVFCIRVTDIAAVPADPEGDRFLFELEFLNWTAREARGLNMSVNVGGIFLDPPPFFAGGATDPNGMPLGPLDLDLNFPPADGFPGLKVGFANPNPWLVTIMTPTLLNWMEPTGLPGLGLCARDLLGSGSTAAACALVPSCAVVAGMPVLPASGESVDNGHPGVDGKCDNVLDGFIIDVDDLDAGELFSFNWILLDAAGMPIGTSGFGNAMGFGTFNIFRVASHGPPILARGLGAPEGPGGNTGTTSSTRDMFISVTTTGEAFEVEPGASLTAPFRNPVDNIFGANINGKAVSAPVNYCTSGTSANGCNPSMSSFGLARPTAASGFVVGVTGAEGNKNGLFFFGQNGRQSNAWGSGTSFQCVIPPVSRGGLLSLGGTSERALVRYRLPEAGPGAGSGIQAAGPVLVSRPVQHEQPVDQPLGRARSGRLSLNPVGGRGLAPVAPEAQRAQRNSRMGQFRVWSLPLAADARATSSFT